MITCTKERDNVSLQPQQPLGKLGYKGFIFPKFSRNFRVVGEDSLPFEVELLVLDVTEGLTTHITDMLRLFMDQNVL